MNIAAIHQLFLAHPHIATDTRKIKPNCIFFALKGPTFNGNAFAKDALKNGAVYAIVDEATYQNSEKTILVEDSLKTLQELAIYHRNYLKTPILSLTGSNGKTTTKELINAVLSKKYNTAATKGNLNNHIGVPLTLLEMNDKTEFGIVEMGANHQREIDFLCNIAFPDYGCITNFGKAHLEGFGGVEGVIKGKSELYHHLVKNQKIIFFNHDDTKQKEILGSYEKIISFGLQSNTDTHIQAVEADPFVKIKTQNLWIQSQLIGSYNATNIALAICIGNYFKIPIQDIKEAIASYIPSNNRSQLLQKKTNKIILDAYNANPTSMQAALENLSKLSDKDKVIILGDMFELGKDANKEHQMIAELAKEIENTTTYLVGEHFYKTKTSLKKFKSFEDFSTFFKNNIPNHTTILIKGSRGMALERILEVM